MSVLSHLNFYYLIFSVSQTYSEKPNFLVFVIFLLTQPSAIFARCGLLPATDMMEKLIQKYDVNLVACMELNFNWSNVNSSANLASWLDQEERETRSITAHTTQEKDELFSRHQPGGTGMVCRIEFVQYAQKASVDPRGLGR